MKVIIMAGGQGTRFWPWSVKKRPKQFLPLLSERTMIQEIYERYNQWLSTEKIFVVTTEEYSELVREQLPQLPREQIIVEPEQKDTAPCTALTALRFLEKGDDEVLVMSPADHYISDVQDLMDSLMLAEKVASDGNTIVTLGIKPSRPETGYGYIKTEDGKEKRVIKVEKFIEKPSNDYAKSLIESKNVFWNSGIFIWRPSAIAYYMEKFHKDMWDTIKDNKNNLKQAYSNIQKISIDYAILEKAEDIFTIPTSFEWDDFGSWGSIERLYKKNKEDNILVGNVYTYSTNNNLIISENKNVMVLGVTDLIIVLTKDGLLVCHKSHEQEIKALLNNTLDYL